MVVLVYMAIDWTEIYKKYKGLWVGIKKEDNKTVIALGSTVKEVMERAKQNGYPDPILFKVPTEIIPMIGAI